MNAEAFDMEQQTSQARRASVAGELTRDDLLELLTRYNEATDRLRASHEALQAEVARLTAELEQKNRELERRERLAMLGEMAAGVAHEIRNPLGGISLYADALIDDLSSLPEQATIARQVQAGVRILNRIVDDMLLFARDLRVERRVHGLDELVGGALELARHDVARSGLQITLDERSLEAEVLADGSLITRALLNMILNAAQAAEGRTDTRLRIAAVRHDENLTVTVLLEDTCGGIAEEDLSRIFNPFFTRRDQGTGLGLAIVHRTVEAHGGETSVENNALGGATFCVTLPLAAGGDESAVLATAATHGSSEE